MSRRWYPPGKGWIRTLDYGSIAAWMRPENFGVSIALYASEYFDDGTETWIVRVPQGSWIPDEVMDKPHRIRWVLDADGQPKDDPEFGALSVERGTVRPSHRGHRRLNRNRHVWCDPLPRKIRAALAVSRGH